MADKKSFVMYLDSWEVISELDTEQRGILLTAIYAIQLGEDLPEMDKETRIVFKTVKNQIIRDLTKYEEKIEKRRAAGKKGAEARWGAKNGKSVENTTPEWQTIANMADSDSDSDSDNDSVSDSDNVPRPVAVHDTQDSLFGVRNNVRLSPEDYQSIVETYQRPGGLIDKVSVWLANARHAVPDHYALVLKFAENVKDPWPRKPPPEPEPIELDPERGPLMGAPAEIREKMRKLQILEG